jgi:hypothetical protein
MKLFRTLNAHAQVFAHEPLDASDLVDSSRPRHWSRNFMQYIPCYLRIQA